MQRAVERHSEGTARVIPIIVRPCDREDTPFDKLQSVPKDANPLPGGTIAMKPGLMWCGEFAKRWKRYRQEEIGQRMDGREQVQRRERMEG